MIGVLLVAHGRMASGLLDAVELIGGEQENMQAIELQEMDAIDTLESKIDEQVQKVNTGDGVLIFVDLFGASPFNASARVAVRYDDVDVITGMNLPMLLEVSFNRHDSDIPSLIDVAEKASAESVRVLKTLLGNVE